MTEPIIINATNLGKYMNGLGVYTLNLIRELSEMETDSRFIIYVNRSCREHLQNIHFSGRCDVRWVSSVISPDHRFRGHFLRLLYANYLGVKHRHSLHFVATQLEAIFFRRNQVITIHDIIPLLFRTSHKKLYFYFKYMLGFVLRRAKVTITPSQHTKDLLVQVYGLPASRVKVIHNGVRQALHSAVEGDRLVENQFILFTGRLVQMKNVAGLLSAFSLIKDKVPHKLVLTGHGTKAMKMELERLRRSMYPIDDDRIVFTGHVSSEEMETLLDHASLLVLPSFYEGFGLPPLEGMAHGCPVVVSQGSSLPEVCADAAVYVDPNDIHSIASGILKMLTDPQLRQTMVVRGMERAQRFRWEDSAAQHMQVFRQAIH